MGLRSLPTCGLFLNSTWFRIPLSRPWCDHRALREKRRWGSLPRDRSPFRPNRIGMSVVKFLELKVLKDSIEVIVSGVDLVDGTPILDIKPYVPYSDSITATSPFEEAPEFKNVRWECEKVPEWELIEKVIALDPRPGHDKDQGQEFGVSLAGWNVRFKFLEEDFVILSVKPIFQA